MNSVNFFHILKALNGIKAGDYFQSFAYLLSNDPSYFLFNKKSSLPARNLVFIGLRDLDPAETYFLKHFLLNF